MSVGLKSSLLFLIVVTFRFSPSPPLTIGRNALISMLNVSALSKCQLDPQLIKLSRASAWWLKLLIMFFVMFPLLEAVALNAGALKGMLPVWIFSPERSIMLIWATKTRATLHIVFLAASIKIVFEIRFLIEIWDWWKFNSALSGKMYLKFTIVFLNADSISTNFLVGLWYLRKCLLKSSTLLKIWPQRKHFSTGALPTWYFL